MNNNEMKAKDLIQSSAPIHEADENPEGRNLPPRPPRRPFPRHMPGPEGEFEMPEGDFPPDMQRLMGRPGQPRGFFNPREVSQLKDVMILMLANAMGSQLDTEIGEALAAGKELSDGQLQHILDEAKRLKLPAGHQNIVQKIHQKLTGGEPPR